MTLRKLLWSLLAITVLWSCGKDDDTPPAPTNTAPVIAAQSFTVVESISDAAAIGTVKASDADDDALTFSIKTNSDNLFEITGAGVLSLASGKSLSFAAKASHSLTVSVTDGTDTASAAVTVNVTEATGEEPTNEAPTAEEQSFEVAEDAAAGDVIGTAAASDEDEDALTFALVTDESELFVVADNGEITLAEGTSLDFETTAEYTLTLSVSDGTNVPVEFMVTVTVTDVNEAPTAADQSIEVAEDQTVVGTAEGSDPEGDELTFALVADESELFQVAENGEISLAEGKNLDFETTTEHTLTLTVTDGTNDPVAFTVTVTVTNVIESLFEDPASFILKFNVAEGQELTIGTNDEYEYDYTIDWGDGTVESRTDQNPSHQYGSASEVSVAIKGTFPALRMTFADTDSKNALVDVAQWGSQKWQTMDYAFFNCNNLVAISDTNPPDLSEVNNMSYMFSGCSSFNSEIGDWDTSNVTEMAYTFRRAYSFNQPLNWNTSNVTNMNGMFSEAYAFNQPLIQTDGGWNTSKVTSMHYMFGNNGGGSYTFNQDLSSWDTSNVTDMSSMFANYGESHAFNQDLSSWDTSNVTDMSSMFANYGESHAFNQDLSSWDTSNVTNMSYMFYNDGGTHAFDQSLAAWDISSVETMDAMLDNCGMSTANYENTLAGWAVFENQTEGEPQQGVTLGAQGLTYCLSIWKSTLINQYGWSISDGGVDPNCP